MSAPPPAPTDAPARAEHPHRCTAGHRWQHGGPTAATCEIPAYDLVSGDLPVVRSEECPVCCGRDDLLVRDLHAHYCNLCDGDWEHEGRCLDSLAACCPWCFPKPDAEAAPGARRGAHFHVCSDCGQNWRHAIGCAAPLRVALPECTGCQSPAAEGDGELREVSPATAPGRPRPFTGRVGPLAVSLGIAAVVVLSIAIGLVRYQAFKVETAKVAAPAIAERAREPRPAPTASVPAAAPTPFADKLRPPATPVQPQRVPPSSRTPSPSQKARPDVSASAAVRAEPRVQPSRPLPAGRPATGQSAAGSSAVGQSVAGQPAAGQRATGQSSAGQSPARQPLTGGDIVPFAPSNPPRSVARSETPTETPARAPSVAAAPSEPAPQATPARAPFSGIPGAPPFGALSGSSGVDNSLESHPRRVAR